MRKSIIEKVLAPEPEGMMVTFKMPYEKWERLNKALKLRKLSKKDLLNRLVEGWLQGS